MARFPSRLRPAGDGEQRWWRRRATPMLLIIAVLAAGVTIGSSGRLEDAVAPPATFALATPEPRTAEEQRYLDAVLPPTERLIGEGRLLSELGETRSRNIIELRTRADRFRSAADDVVRVEREQVVPSRLEPFSTALNLGIASALAAIDDAQAAILRFDWDQVALSVSSFTAAVDVIAEAIDLVEQQ